MNSSRNRWLLPEGIDELLPPQAAHLESLCREIIDLYTSWGYQLVITPLIEYLDSLLTGTGEDLELQTFKLTDQLSGRMMGVRADITPQVARIDAHKLKQDAPTRLCYLGTTLHTRPGDKGGNRSPLQVGAELYGHAGIESDTEIMKLMLETMKVAGVENLFVDLGHVGIYAALVKQAKFSKPEEDMLFDILLRKDGTELEALLKTSKQSRKIHDAFIYIMNATGGHEILAEARNELSGMDEIDKCLDDIAWIIEKVADHYPEVVFNIDLTELRGYHYHTGLIFTAYVADRGRGIAFGGRYDDIGQFFGRARPATGFSTDVKLLLELSNQTYIDRKGIFAPAVQDESLMKYIAELRTQGEVVIQELTGQTGNGTEQDCDRQLVNENGTWKIITLNKK